FSLRVEGKGVPGWVKGTAKLQISPNAEGSELQCDSEGQVGGVIAAVGSRLIEAVGKKMQDEFFRKLGEQLGGELGFRTTSIYCCRVGSGVSIPTMNDRMTLLRLDTERQTIPDAEITLYKTPHVVRAIAKQGSWNGIVYSRFLSEEAEMVIGSEIGFFTK